MKFLAFLVLVIAVFTFASADDTCIIDGQTFKIGETYQPHGKCLIKECKGAGQLTAKGCPDFHAPPHCTITEDKSKKYPECCPQAHCD